MDGIQLELKSKKEALNYAQTIENHFKDGGFKKVISWLNALPEELPLSIFDVNWKYLSDPSQVLCATLENAAFDFIFSQNFDCLELIQAITKRNYREAITKGFFNRLLLLKKDALPVDRVLTIKNFVKSLFKDSWPQCIDAEVVSCWIKMIGTSKKALNPTAGSYFRSPFLCD